MGNLLTDRLSIDDVVMLREGKNDSPVAYTGYGKVIIAINKPKIGYAKITKIVKDAPKYILVEAENVIHDYYNGISHDEFKEVLKLHGYKIGFDRPFETENGTDYQILAYNFKNGVIVVGETYFAGTTYNSIDVYCPNVSAFTKTLCFSSGGGKLSKLNLCYSKNYDGMLSYINRIVKNPVWDTEEDIYLWTYADSQDYNLRNDRFYDSEKWGVKSSGLWAETIDRILLADKEIEQILGKCTRLIPVFASRDKSSR